jgi:hypothetical protein
MQIIHWLFVVSVSLFVSGIGLVIAGGRATRASPAVEAAAPAATPVATVRQIMTGIIRPAAGTVFGAVGTIVTAGGTEERRPRTDAEWEEVATSAAALIEAGNLLQRGNRVVDKNWIKMSQALTAAGTKALKAAQAQSPDDVMAVGEDLYLSCDNCHQRYMRGS